jgi:hypothetical protein
MKFTAHVLIVLVAANCVLAQDNAKARNDAYSRCISYARSDVRYKYCKDYLEKYPDDDPQHREDAEKFVRDYDRVSAYAEALQSFALSKSNTWFIYEPDLKLDVPNVNEQQGHYRIRIERSFKNAAEAEMLKKTEAVYGPQFKYIDVMRRTPLAWAQDLSDEIMPLWGVPANDNVIMCDVITSRAVRYYYDLSVSSRENRRFRDVFPMSSTGLKYTASIKYFDEWEHANSKYHEVYLADLNLEWSSRCGGRCGIGFTRNKLVVFNKQGEILDLYLDAPVNHSMWVS